MKCYYDFHIHTCLSPCGGEDNTPNNVVNFAKMLGLDAIAICDHNTAGNVSACMKVGAEVGVVVVPGMEVTTSEDIHVVCLFETLEMVERLDKIVTERLAKMPNDERIFGEQIYMNENDEVVGKNENFTLYGVAIDIYELVQIVKDVGGVCFPAHVFKEGSGILPILGDISEDIGFVCIEKGRNATAEQIEKAGLGKYFVLDNSDAHYLENMREAENYIECEKSLKGIIDFLRTRN